MLSERQLEPDSSVDARLGRLLARPSEALEAHGGWVGAVLLAIFLVASLGNAAWKFLWYDELVTVGAASLPTAHDVVQFFSSGLDTTSGTCALIVRAALRLPVSPELSVRLPFILSFACTLVCVVAFVRRRYPTAYALAAATLLVLPPLLTDLTVEARGYAIALGATSIAMLAWQAEAEASLAGMSLRRSLRVLGIWFGLALALNVHAFAIFLFPAFALAQIAADRREHDRREHDRPERRIDWPVWIAICLAPLGLAPAFHGEQLAKGFYGSHFRNQPHPDLILESYREMILESGITLVLILLGYCFLVGLARWQRSREQLQMKRAGGFSRAEWTLLGVLAAMPFYALPAAYLLHVYRTRYVIFFAIGLFIAIAALLAELAWRSRRAGTALLLALLLCAAPTILPPFLHGLRISMNPVRLHADRVREFNELPWVKMLDTSPLPVAAGDNNTYGQLKYYGSAELNSRLAIVTDVPEIEKYPDSQTTQMNMVLFGHALSYNTADIAQYSRRNGHFLLATRPDIGTWIIPFLLDRQKAGSASVSFLGPTFDRVPGHVTVFDVHTLPIHRKNESSSPAAPLP